MNFTSLQKTIASLSLTMLGVIVGAALAIFFSMSGVSKAMSLHEAFELTNRNSPSLKAARQNVRATNEQIRQLLGAALPQISGSASSSLSYSEQLNSQDALTDTLGYQLSISQVLFAGGSVGGGINQAESTVRAAWYDLASQEQAALSRTAVAYMSMVLSDTVVALNKSAIQLQQELLSAARARLEAGVATITDVAVAEASVAGARANLAQNAQQKDISAAELFSLTGQRITSVSNPGLPSNMPQSLDDAMARALSNSPAIRSARASASAAEKAIRVAKAALLPTVNAQASAGTTWSQTNGSDYTDRNSYSVTASASIPIYRGGATLSTIKQAKYNHSRALALVQQSQFDAKANVMRFWGELNSQKALIASTQAQIDAEQAALAAVAEQANLGQASLLDVIQKENALEQAKISLAQAQVRYITAAYQLKGAMGELTPNSVGGGQVFNPVSNFDYVKQAGQVREITRQNVPTSFVELQELPGQFVDFMNF